MAKKVTINQNSKFSMQYILKTAKWNLFQFFRDAYLSVNDTYMN